MRQLRNGHFILWLPAREMEVLVEPDSIIQTTVVHPLRPEFSFAAVSINPGLSGAAGLQAIMKALKIDPISVGAISESELAKVVSCLLLDDLTVFNLNEKEFNTYVNDSGVLVEFLDQVMFQKRIILDTADPRPESLVTFVDNAESAALGLYSMLDAGEARDFAGPEGVGLLIAATPRAMIICGSARGLYEALGHGLYERIHKSLATSGSRRAPAAVNTNPQ